MSEPKNVSARSKVVPKVAIVTAAIVVVGLFGAWFVRTDAFKLATTHQPERFTELYFVDPNKLPSTVTAGKTYTTNFAIVNHEASLQTYAYQVVVTYDGQRHVQEAVRITLSDGQRVTPHFSYTIPEAEKTAEVTVTLLEEQQSIHFKVES